jgi:hypothetical protein
MTFFLITRNCPDKVGSGSVINWPPGSGSERNIHGYVLFRAQYGAGRVLHPEPVLRPPARDLRGLQGHGRHLPPQHHRH